MSPSPLFDDLRGKTPLISVGLVSANLMNLDADLTALENAGVQLLHFDVMDGVFCPTMTLGPPFIKAVKTSLLKDVHLMIDRPLDKIRQYVEAGADMITVHAESSGCIHRILQILPEMKNANDPDRGILRGIAVNPGTPLQTIEPLLGMVEMVFLLAINPGYPGQKLCLTTTQKRLRRLIEMIKQSGTDILVGIDGGVKPENIADIARTGPDIIVTGSAVFRPGTPEKTAKEMIETVKKAVTPHS
ncbi:MAG: ribulose-phosphate 3-epimerase [Sedimentisphaerales bacterium]|nr:ribulose-phosphate 3-epimerase [Sedimentisphaerales bacterium]